MALLLAFLLLAAFTSTAYATVNYEIRGEWSITVTAPQHGSLSGTAVLDSMQPNGEYSGTASFLGGAAVSGTVSGDETSIKVLTSPAFGQISFVANALTIDTAENKFSGSGDYYNAKNELIEPGEVKCVRIKTYQEVIEREEREKREAEERSARANVRGEWELTVKAGGQTSKAIALITDEANSKNEFSSSKLTFEGTVPGTFQGTLEGEKATVKVTSDAEPGVPATEFTSKAISVTSAANPASMSGTGEMAIPELSIVAPGELTATRIHTYSEVLAREAREAREAKEAQEAQERETLKAKEALEAKERERLAGEAATRRAREEREVRERLESKASVLTLLPVAPLGKTFAATGVGALPLRLTNPNAASVHGHVTVVLLGASGASLPHKGKPKQMTLGAASFTIAPHASQSVSIKLSHSGTSTLAHRHTLHVTITITTESKGATGVSRKYSVTLTAHHGKG